MTSKVPITQITSTTDCVLRRDCYGSRSATVLKDVVNMKEERRHAHARRKCSTSPLSKMFNFLQKRKTESTVSMSSLE